MKGIKKSLEAAKGAWVDDLPGVIWSARTTTKEATEHSLFGLVYGSEVVLPVEVGYGTLITSKSSKSNVCQLQ